MRRAAFLAAVVLVAAPVTAQETVRIDPEEARTCAIWASYVASELVEDPATQQALMMATNYFVGHYEGVTGVSIAQGDDRVAAERVVLNLAETTQMCTRHMESYSNRMVQWGDLLQRLGEAGAG